MRMPKNACRHLTRAALAGSASLLFSAAALAQACEVKVGMAGPLTGGASAWGLAMKTSMEFVATRHNDAGGLPVGDKKCKVNVVTVDAQCSAAGGAAASNYLASQNVKILIGPVCSPETTGFQPLSNRHKQIFFNSSYKADSIGPDWPYGFHMHQGPKVFGPTIIKAGADRFKFKTAIIMGPNDQGGTDSGNQSTAIYRELGVKAEPEWYQRGTTNFGPIAARIMAQNPDIVELAAMPPPDVTNFVRQLTQAGYAGVYGGMGGIGMEPVVQGAGGVDKIKGYFWLELMPVEDPGALRLREDYKKTMKSEPTTNAMLYTSTFAAENILRAVSLAGTDSDVDKLADVLRKTAPESEYFGKGCWRGKAQYGINQEFAFPVGMGVIQDGKRVGVQRIDLPCEQ
jgi:branched-chain amino acid transport system substrate-binding protein